MSITQDLYCDDSFPFAFGDGKRTRGVFLALDSGGWQIGDVVFYRQGNLVFNGVVIGCGGWSQSGYFIDGLWVKVTNFTLHQDELEVAFGPTLEVSQAKIGLAFILFRFLLIMWLMRCFRR